MRGRNIFTGIYIISFLIMLISCGKEEITPLAKSSVDHSKLAKQKRKGLNKQDWTTKVIDWSPTQNHRYFEDFNDPRNNTRYIGCHARNIGNCMATVDVGSLNIRQKGLMKALASILESDNSNPVAIFTEHENEFLSIFSQDLVKGVIDATYTVHLEVADGEHNFFKFYDIDGGDEAQVPFLLE